jgi:predicted ATPase/class 3 adenylate cyclase
MHCTACGQLTDSWSTQCRNCGARLATTCTDCGGENVGSASFCSRCGSSLQSREAPASNAVEGEKRLITCLFSDIVGSVSLSDRLGVEDFGEVLAVYHDLCGRVVQRWHGYVAQFLGDGVLVYFGYPAAFEDSAASAVHAGLELLQSVRDTHVRVLSRSGLSLVIRVGIHTGSVVLESVGRAGRRETLALGDAPNLASRVQAAAAPGALAISDSTESCLRGRFGLKKLGVRTFKGVSRPVELFEVLAPNSASDAENEGQLSGSQTPFLGRTRETQFLLDRFRLATRGQSCAVILRGEAGVGKSRQVKVLEQGIAHEAHVSVVLRCDEHHRESVLHPLAEAMHLRLSPLFGTEGGLDPFVQLVQTRTGAPGAQTLALLGHLLSVRSLEDPMALVSLSPAEIRTAMFDLVSAWLSSEIGDSPAVIVIEDLHWADSSTLDFIGQALHAPIPRTIMLCTARPEFTVPQAWLPTITELSIDALDRAECTQLVAHLARATPLSQELLDRVLANSSGIPLFVEETTKTVIDSAQLAMSRATPARTWIPAPDIVPTSLHAAVVARLDSLGTARVAAQLASVIGNEFRKEMFTAVVARAEGFALSGERWLANLDELARARVVLRQDVGRETVYAFRHALVRKAAYESLSRRARILHHRTVAEVLIQCFQEQVVSAPEVVAAHYSAAEMPASALPLWVSSAEKSMLASAYPETASHLNHALRELSQLQPSVERDRLEVGIRQRLGLVHVQTSGFAASEVDVQYGRASELCDALGDEMQQRPEVLYGVWLVSFVRGDLRGTTRLVRHFQSLAEHSEEPDLQLIACAALGNFAFYRGDYTEAVRCLERARALCEPQRAREQYARLIGKYGFEGLLYGPLYLAWTHAFRGERELAESCWNEALAIANVIDSPYVTAQVYTFGAAIYRDLGSVDTASALAAVVGEKFQRFAFWAGCASAIAGWAEAKLGQAEAAIPKITDAIGLLRAIGVRVPVPYYLGCLSEALMLAGRTQEALATIDEAIQMASVDIDCNFVPSLEQLKAKIAGSIDSATHVSEPDDDFGNGNSGRGDRSS